MKTILILLILATQLAISATYYVDPDNGNNSNNGLGPDASAATNKPWLTFGKALSTVVSGDLVYLAPGVYRENNTLTQTWTSETIFRGDPLNAQRFKNSSGVLKAKGFVRITGHTTNDTTAGAAAALIATNNKDYFTLENCYLYPTKKQTAIDCSGGASDHLTFRRCYIQTLSGGGGTGAAVFMVLGFGQVADFTMDSCIILSHGSSSTFTIYHTPGTGSDWDANVDIKNCVIMSPGNAVWQWIKDGGAANVAGGMTVTNCTIFSTYAVLSTGTSSTFPHVMRNNYISCADSCYIAGNTSQIDSDYNMIVARGTDSSTNRGANDQEANWNARLDLGASQLFRLSAGKPWFSAVLGAPVLGAGTGNPLSTDLMGKERPNPNSIGALEYHAPPNIGK